MKFSGSFYYLISAKIARTKTCQDSPVHGYLPKMV